MTILRLNAHITILKRALVTDSEVSGPRAADGRCRRTTLKFSPSYSASSCQEQEGPCPGPGSNAHESGSPDSMLDDALTPAPVERLDGLEPASSRRIP